MFGFDHLAVDIWRYEPTILSTHIVPICENVKVFPHLLQIVVARLDVDFGDLAHQPIGKLRLSDQGHQETLEPHASGRLLKEPATDDSAAYQGIIRVFVKVLSLFAKSDIVFWGVGWRPGVVVQGLHSGFLNGKLHPVEVQPPIFGHMQFGAPTVDEGIVVAFLKDIQVRRCSGRQLDHTKIYTETLQKFLIQVGQLLDIVHHLDLF